MIAKVMKGVAPDQESREKGRDKTAQMDGGRPEATQHADTTEEGEQEKRQRLQQQPKPKQRLKLKPKLQHEPKPKSAPTPARRWKTVPPQAQSQNLGPTPTSGSSMGDRRLVIRKNERIPRLNRMDEEIVSAVTRALFQQ